MILPLTKNIYAYAQHILSNPTDAADITQEVMIKLWNTRRELKGVQNPRAWALKVIQIQIENIHLFQFLQEFVCLGRKIIPLIKSVKAFVQLGDRHAVFLMVFGHELR